MNTDISLNDALMDRLFKIVYLRKILYLIRFRTYEYAITADIEKMYLQVLVNEDERRCFVKQEKIEIFQLNTLAFGVASSSFLAIRYPPKA